MYIRMRGVTEYTYIAHGAGWDHSHSKVNRASLPKWNVLGNMEAQQTV
jgi:hypothetical protein